MAFIPEQVRAPKLPGLKHLNSGKTGEMYEISSEYLLMVRTDRISIFDFVLRALVAYKGIILNTMSINWIVQVLQPVLDKFGANHHLVAYGILIDDYLPKELRGNPDLQMRSTVIKRLPKTDYEAIVRGYLTGSGLKAYLRDGGLVCGHQLVGGLHDGIKLNPPIFTPSDKADVGHDEHIDYRWVRNKYGDGPEMLALDLYATGRDYAQARGFILADTKFEFSFLDDTLFLMDEVLTPDSSRFWLGLEWRAAQEKNPPRAPSGFDKEYVRAWGKTVETPFFDERGASITGINNLDPENEEHLNFVSKLDIPQEVCDQTSFLYKKAFSELFGAGKMDALESFWQSIGVRVA